MTRHEKNGHDRAIVARCLLCVIDDLLERVAALEGHLLGVRLWAVDQSDTHDAFTRRNGGQVVKPNVFDGLAERMDAALANQAPAPEVSEGAPAGAAPGAPRAERSDAGAPPDNAATKGR